MTKFNKKAFIKAATKVEEIMSTPSKELTFEQTKEIDKFLEGYNRNPSNSNKWRYALHAHIDKLLTEQADSLKQSLVAEMPKYRDNTDSKATLPEYDDFISVGFNQAVDDANQAVTKVFDGRM